MTLGQHYISAEASAIGIMTTENAISRNSNLAMSVLLFLTIEMMWGETADTQRQGKKTA